MNEQITSKNVYDIMIRIAFLALIIAWCLMILLPFTSIILWGVILAIALLPLHTWLCSRLGDRKNLSAIIIMAVMLLFVLIPGFLFVDSITESTSEMKRMVETGSLTIPPPTEKVKTWPLIGQPVYELWDKASVDLRGTLLQHKEQLAGVGQKILAGMMSVLSGGLQMIIAIIIGGGLLMTKGSGEAIRKFFRKVAGTRGDEFADLTKKTVGNVIKGILGVAFIQAFIIGLGFVLAGVPLAGLWTLLVFILGVLQIPPALVVIPVIVYLFSMLDTLPAILWSVYLLAGGLSDNILKPILLGKGAPVPMLVIFLGVIGGFMFSGFIGLFTGAVVVSVGYRLLVAWIEPATSEN